MTDMTDQTDRPSHLRRAAPGTASGQSSDRQVSGQPALGEADVRHLLDGWRVGILVFDAEDLRVVDASPWARRALALPAQLDGRGLGDLFVGLSNRHAQALLRRLREDLVDHVVVETRLRTADGSVRPVELRFGYSAVPSPRYLALVLDGSERSQPDELATRRERLRDALAEILRVLSRIDDRDELYREACRIAVERGGFRMAWIGLVDGQSGDIVPVASAGDSDGYVEKLRLNVRQDRRGPGMTVTAIRTGSPIAIADPRADSMFTTLKRQVIEHGFQSAVSLPLVVEGKPIGALTVYGGVVNAFGAIEVELLQHLADDMSFKLEVIGREEIRRAAEAERDRLAAVVEQAGESVVITERDGRIVYTNPAFTRLTGFTRDEALGRNMGFLASESQTTEEAAAISGTIAESASWTGSVHGRRKDGQDVDLNLVISPRVDESGELVGSIIIGRDVSREKSLEAQLRQSQKMEAVGRLAGGVAHDFNNLLTAISGYAEMLSTDLGPEDPRTLDVAEIQRAAGRATQLTRQLLAFSRRQVLSPRPLDPQTVVADLAPMLRRLIGEDIELVVDVGSGVGPIMADPSQLDQVLVNLALNARDAMPTGGRLVIEAREIELDEAFAVSHLGARPGRYVVLRVRDTGTGMTPAVLQHAFEPFFTTKGPGKGTGLGLATVLGIVEQSNGYVDVDTEPDGGSTFRVFLPKVAQAPAQASQAEATVVPETGRGTATILVVEDEEPVRSLACRILRMAGYTVLEAGSGEEALELEARYVGPIDLLFTDVILSGMSGHEVANVLKGRRPSMPVMYASGYNEERVLAQGVLESGVSYMPKPYGRTELLSRVRALVGDAADRTDGPAA
jgi:PAS domain S-box-containing protein